MFWFLTVFKNYILLLTYRISLHAPETSPLPNIFFVNIFLQSLVCLFIFLITPFGEHIFNFDEVYQIPVISSYSNSYSWCGKRACGYTYIMRYYSVSFRYFIVLAFIFGSVIYVRSVFM